MLEMLVLLVIALGVFGYVLVPLVRPHRRDEIVDNETQSVKSVDEPRESVSADSRPVRDTS